MKLASLLMQRSLRLPPPPSRDLAVDRDLVVPMRDGALLLADRWYPESGGDGLPAAVIRSPYGRATSVATAYAKPLAERGFQAVVVSSRGTFGSGGEFDPFRCEREDGLDALDWVVQQPWFGDAMILAGGSYLGFTQWAVADRVPPEVKAMIPVVTQSNVVQDMFRADAFQLETPYEWGVQVAGQERRFAPLRTLLTGRQRQRALRTLPLRDADTALLGRPSGFVQDVLDHDAGDPFWAALDHRDRVAGVAVPVSLVAGWYDFFLPGQLLDFAALRDAGRAPRITIGPWPHASLQVGGAGIRESLEFGLAHARGEEPPERAPVRLYVMGEEAWRDFPAWPPAGYEPTRFHLRQDGKLDTGRPGTEEPDAYRYDPADPTPAVGGCRLGLGRKAGRADNRALEARPDVLTYTGPVLDEDVEVIGEAGAEIWFRSSLPHADVFVRLCDVDAGGRSHNVCDGLVSLTGADELTRAVVDLWPTAHRFKGGHRIRVQVSSGAFPHYNRNPGTGAPRGDATELRAAVQLVFHDPEHPSAVILPVARPAQ